jgi:hypothetical protein
MSRSIYGRRYGLDDQRFESRQTSSGTHPSSYSVGTGAKQLGVGDVDESLPSSAGVENEWSYTSLPSWRGQDNYILPILCKDAVICGYRAQCGLKWLLVYYELVSSWKECHGIIRHTVAA